MSEPDKKSNSLDALLGSLKYAAVATVNRDEYMASAAATELAISELRAELELTLASALRDRNSRTLVGRVPPELWLYVWNYASFDDMVSIARVCHGWRTLSHAQSKLWNSVTIESSLHHNSCDCDECETSLSRAGVTNLGPARIAVEQLSKGRHITLTVSSTHWQTNETFVKHLQSCIGFCAARLVELNITYNDNLFPSSVLDKVDIFPALRTLRMVCLDPGFLHESSPFLCSDVQFPELRALDVGDYLSWPAPEDLGSQLNLPAIMELTCTFGTAYDLGLALQACWTRGSARLVNLAFHWRLSPLEPGIFAINDMLNAVLDELRNARITNISAALEDDILAVFARSRREYLQLGYMEKTVAQGLCACRNLELEHGLALRLARFGDAIELDVFDGVNAVEVAFPALPAGRATINWDTVPESLTSLSVDAALWDDVLHALPPTPRVNQITLRVTDNAGLECVRPRGDSASWVFSPEVTLLLESNTRRYGDVLVHSANVERVKALLNASTVSFHGVLVRD